MATHSSVLYILQISDTPGEIIMLTPGSKPGETGLGTHPLLTTYLLFSVSDFPVSDTWNNLPKHAYS